MKRFLTALVLPLALLCAQSSYADSGKGHDNDDRPLPPLVVDGIGTVTSLGTPGCSSTPGGCTTLQSGTFSTTHYGSGTWSSTVHTLPLESTSNGQGGYCTPATDTTVMDFGLGNTLTFSDSLIICQIGPDSITAPHFAIGTSTIVTGTGHFRDVSGGGEFSAGDSYPNLRFHALLKLVRRCFGKDCDR